MAISRRNWLQMTGAALGGAPLLQGFEDFFRPASPSASTAQTMTTACGVCAPECGIRATVQDGVLRFLEGLPGDASGGGALCGRGSGGAGLLYDPDRLKYPMKRTNPRKGLDQDPGWVRISWDEALDTIAAKFGGYIRQHGADSLLFLSRGSPEPWARFINAIGAINRVDHNDICFTTDSVVQRYATGGRSNSYDFENSKYLLLFGFEMLSKCKIVYAQGMIRAKDSGAKIVCFNPEHSTTARFSDEWYPIRPGSDLAVALAMINVIISENLHDREFVDNFTNFKDFESRIRTHFAQYTPEWAERLSDVPAAAITRIAREFATTRPACAPAYKKSLTANYANSGQLTHAITILNILAGTIDRPGGRYFPRRLTIQTMDQVYPPPAFPAKTGVRIDGRDKLPLVTREDHGMFSTLVDGMLNKHPGRIKGAFVNYYTVLGFPEPLKMIEALRSVEFTVVIDTLPTDTVTLADIALPSSTYLESTGLMSRAYEARKPQVVARQAVVPAMFESRSIGWVAIELGKRLAPDYFKTPTGAWISTSALLDEQTRRAGLGANFAEFRRIGIFDRDDRFVPRTTFATATGKCQIYIPEFEARGYPALPDWRPRRDEPSARYPYYYLTYLPPVHRRNSTQNNPIAHEIMPSNAAVIHPMLAERHKIRHGQMVRVSSRVGSIELPAHLTERIRPDCVMVAHGFGHRSRLMRLASGKGARDGDLIPGWSVEEMLAHGDFAGSGCIMDAVVNIEPV